MNVLRKSVIFYILYHFYIEDLSNALITVNVFIFFCTFRLNCFFTILIVLELVLGLLIVKIYELENNVFC